MKNENSKKSELVNISILITVDQKLWFLSHPEYNVSGTIRKKLDEFIAEHKNE